MGATDKRQGLQVIDLPKLFNNLRQCRLHEDARRSTSRHKKNIGSVRRIDASKSGQVRQQRAGSARIIPVGDSRRAQLRRKGCPVQTKTFSQQIGAAQWPQGIEADPGASRAGMASASGVVA